MSPLTPPNPCCGGVASRPEADAAGAVEALPAPRRYGRLPDPGSLDRVFCDEVARPVTEVVQAALQAAAAPELPQALALVHDDVMDGSELRRGEATVHVDRARRHRAATRVTPRGAPAASAVEDTAGRCGR